VSGAAWLAGGVAFAARLVSGANARWLAPVHSPRQRIYYANHTSHLDAVVIWSLLPKATRRLTRPIAAADYWSRGLVRPVLARDTFNAVLIPRRAAGVDDPEAVRAAAREAVTRTAEALGDRYSAIIFPEGTRGDGEEVAPFKSGLYHLCEMLPGVELVPVYVENLNRILPKGSIVPAPLLTRVTFGEPLDPVEGEERDAFLARIREALLELRAPA
jgi:1-acyl-sn-glycerol-3-phosphate acyltransferase